MEKIIVKNIKWLSVPASEAEVEVSDGRFSFFAFSCPCEIQVNDEVSEPLHVFGLKSANLVSGVEPGIWPADDKGLNHRLIAEIINISEQLLKIGSITLIVDNYLPNIFEQGDLIELDCSRIDIW